MTRTDVMASSRPDTAGAAPKRNRSRATRWLTVFPIVLLMGMALFVPAAALAETTAEQEQKSTYTQEVEKPKTAEKETEPTKEAEKKTEPTPTTTTSPEATQTLPFTGFDLRWSVGIGVLLMAAGFSIVAVQRRQHREGGR